jgi:hypothetical protein
VLAFRDILALEDLNVALQIPLVFSRINDNNLNFLPYVARSKLFVNIHNRSGWI